MFLGVKMTSPHEQGRDVALSRSPEKGMKWRRSPSSQPGTLPSSHWSIRFTLIFGLCPKPNSVTAIYPQPMAKIWHVEHLHDELDILDVRILVDRQTQSSRAIGRASCYPLKKYQFIALHVPAPGFWRLPIYLAHYVLFITTRGAPDPCWRVHWQTQFFTGKTVCITNDLHMAANL